MRLPGRAVSIAIRQLVSFAFNPNESCQTLVCKATVIHGMSKIPLSTIVNHVQQVTDFEKKHFE